jgi:hypothetical protein
VRLGASSRDGAPARPIAAGRYANVTALIQLTRRAGRPQRTASIEESVPIPTRA